MMTKDLFRWNGKYETGLAEIDSQHRRLVELINGLGGLRRRGAQAADLQEALDALTDYARSHFATEEALMVASGVSAEHQARHCRAHGEFLVNLGDLASAHQGNLLVTADRLLRYLVKWLTFHILEQDREMSRQVAARQRGETAPAAGSDQAAPPGHNGEVLVDALLGLLDGLGEAHGELVAAHAEVEHTSRLARSVLVAQEEERRRLSCTLHDTFGANLVAINIGLNTVRKALAAAGLQDAGIRLNEVQALLRETSTSIREICLDLRPPVLDAFGLLAALEGYITQFRSRTGIVVEVSTGRMEDRMPQEPEVAVFRIAQEALSNCARHSHARHVRLALAPATPHMVLTVSDDGVGFDPETAKHRGLGLITMRERAELAGGHLHIDSRPGGGTRLTAVV